MYCKQEPDETLIIIKSEWARDKSLLRTERRSCNSNFSTECQILDPEFQLKSLMKCMKSIWCFFRNVLKAILKVILVSYSTNLPSFASLFETMTGSLIVPDITETEWCDALHKLNKFVLCKTETIFRIAWHF